jgi:radical SAM superfamily enzyme
MCSTLLHRRCLRTLSSLLLLAALRRRIFLLVQTLHMPSLRQETASLLNRTYSTACFADWTRENCEHYMQETMLVSISRCLVTSIE